MGRMQRNKGAKWERELAIMLRGIYPGARRGLSQPRSGCDVPDVEDAGPYWWEAKHGKQVNLRAALRQAIEAEAAWRAAHPESGPRVPVVVAKDDRREPVALLPLEAFLSLLAQLRRPDAANQGDLPPSKT